MIRRLIHPLIFLGFSPAALKEKRHLLRYWRERRAFRQLGGQITHSDRILSDYREQAGVASGHYFHQDLLVASHIYAANPRRHIDVGSRLDGFVAHVAAFRPIETIDIRPLKPTGHLNIQSLQADLMDAVQPLPTADSISCLHAIEHFGLGRYGDPIDPDGHKKGFTNLLRMIEPNGTLYISFPIGPRNEVHFNGHRVFHPLDILNWPGSSGLQLKRFDFVDRLGALHQNIDLRGNLPSLDRGCGIYSFARF
jgi:hypothetical protein